MHDIMFQVWAKLLYLHNIQIFEKLWSVYSISYLVNLEKRSIFVCSLLQVIVNNVTRQLMNIFSTIKLNKEKEMENVFELLIVLYLHHQAKQEKINTKCIIFS